MEPSRIVLFGSGTILQIRDALTQRPEIEFVGWAPLLQEAIEICRHTSPDLVLIELRPMDARYAIQQQMLSTGIHRLTHDLNLPVLAIGSSRYQVIFAMLNGALGFIEYGASPEEILEAIEEIRQGYIALSTEHFNLYKRFKSLRLSPRERELIGWIRSGLSHQQIAEQMGIQPKSVHRYLKRIQRKLGIRSPTELGEIIELLTLIHGNST